MTNSFDKRPGSCDSGKLLARMMSYKASDVIDVALRLGIIDNLKETPRTTEQLANQTSCDADYLGTLLDFMVRIDVLQKQQEQYAISESFSTMGPLILLENETRKWHAQNDSLYKVMTTGLPQDPMNSPSEKLLEIYNLALSNYKRSLALNIFRHNLVSKQSHFIDLGGADGALASELVRLNSIAFATVIDRPHAEPAFQRRITAHKITNMRFIGADLNELDLASVKTDAPSVICLSNVAHLLDLPARQALWKRILETLEDNAIFVMYDQFAQPSRKENESFAELTAADYMIIDWLKCAANYDLTVGQQVKEIESCGFKMLENHPINVGGGAIISFRKL
ncbi:MAG: class I SAM-dependent methyltransferase [Aestuariibacter sp.]